MKYNFIDIPACNMCQADEKSQKILGKRLNHSQGKRPSQKKGITVSIVQCKNCGLIFSNPMPVPGHISDHYGTPPEDYWKPAYFEVDPNYFQTEIRQLKKLMHVKEGMKALDIGAGLGKAMIALKNSDFETFGFEPSLPFYERAIEKMNIPKTHLQNATIESAEYEADFFDFITFGAVLEHLYDPSSAIKKTLHWLKPNGIIHIQVPSSQWLINKVANLYYKLTCTDYVANISPMHIPFHLYEFDLKSFTDNSRINKYKIVHHRYWVAQTFMPQIVSPFFCWLMKKTNTGMQLEIWLQKHK